MNFEQAEFTLAPDETPRDRFGRPHPRPPSEKGGRRPGSISKVSRELKAMCEKRGINFLHKMWDRAERLEDEIDFKCAVFIGSRLWTKPRGNPVTLDLSQNVDARSLLLAVAEGQITPADASSLWNALSRNGSGSSESAEVVPRDDVRERIAERLASMVTARRIAAGDVPPANAEDSPDVEDDSDAMVDELMAEIDRMED
jgi:hypothetical protein